MLALVALAGIVGFAVASSWDVAWPFPPRGTDWGHYLLYAEEVAEQGQLLVDDPLAERTNESSPTRRGRCALRRRPHPRRHLVVVADVRRHGRLGAVAAERVRGCGTVLWGVGAGLVAAGAYAVSPIQIDPMCWHGLGTTLAMLFVPLVVLALG